MNYRIDGLTLEASLDILTNEIRNLIGDKRRHVNDLIAAARVLQTYSTDQTRVQTMKQQIEQLEHILRKTEEQLDKRLVFDFPRHTLVNQFVLYRIKKTEGMLKILHDFEHNLENLRTWMDTTEAHLQRPFSAATCKTSELQNYQQTITVCST